MPTDEKRYAILAKQLRNFDYVIIDTCSLMEDSFPDWMNVFEKAKKEYVDGVAEDFHAYVPYRCYEELKNHVKIRSKDPELINRQIAAKRALRIVRWAKFRRILEITPKDKTENFSDNAITVKVIHDRLDKRILVITQDKGLASDLLYWNHSQSQRGKYIAVYRLMPNAELAPNRGKVNKEQTPQKQPVKNESTAKPSFDRSKNPKRETPKPAPKTEYDAVYNDKRLKALLTNPNYPLDKKRKDVQAHLEGLSTIPDDKRASMNLQLSEGALREFLLTGNYTEKASTPPVVLEKEDSPEAEIKKLRYSDGFTLKEAISQCASIYNILFRYHTIPYNAQFHGPLDLTETDLDEIARLVDRSLDGNNLIKVEYNKILVYVMPRNVSFRVWIDISPALPKPAPETKPTEEPKKKQKSAKKAKKTAEPAPIKETKVDEPAPKVDEPKPESKKTQKPAKKKATQKPEQKPVAKEEAKAEPKPEAKPEPSKKSKKQPAKKEQPSPKKKEEPKQPPKQPEPKPAPAPKKEEKPAKEAKQPKPKKDAKQEPVKPKNEPAKKQPESKKATPAKKQEPVKKEQEPKKPAKVKPEQKQAKPAQAPKNESKQEKAKPAPKQEKQKPEPKKAEKPKQTPLEEAIACDKKLKANVNNPNYPLASKVADLKSQLERIKKLKPEDRKQLSLSIDTIKMMLAMYGPSK